MTDPVPRAVSRRRLLLGAVGLAAMLAAGGLYAARRSIAHDGLSDWLQDRGVASEVTVDSFGFSAFTGRLRLGDRARPDLTAERAEVSYRLTGFWRGDPLGVEVTEVRLRAPVLRARLKDGKLSFGSLDPVVTDFMGRPTPKRQPRIVVDKGVLLLATDFGPVRLAADAVADDGRLVSLDASSAPTRLNGPGLAADLGAGALTARTKDGRFTASLALAIPQASGAGGDLVGGRLRVTAETAYPDMKGRRAEGPVSVRATLVADSLGMAGGRLAKARIVAGFTGRAIGWTDTLALTGGGAAELSAESGILNGSPMRQVKFKAQASDLRWTRTGGDAVTANLSGEAGLASLMAADLRLTRVAATVQGPLVWRPKGGAGVSLATSFSADGSWSGLGPPLAADSLQTAALKRGLRDFHVSAPGLGVRASEGGWAVDANRSVRLTTRSGGTAAIHARGAAPLIGSAGGAMRVQMEGGGLPRADATIERLTLAAGGLTASGRLRADQLFMGPLQAGGIDAAGTLRASGGSLSFVADRCVAMSADRLEFGENDIERLTGRLCPSGGPLLALSGEALRLRGRAEGFGATAATMQVQVDDGAGSVELTQAGGDMRLRADIDRARLVDMAAQPRFFPLQLSGRAGMAGEALTGLLVLATPQGQPLARVGVRHQAGNARGGAEIDTGMLEFTPDGLQPARLSPLAGAIGSPATGQARFEGRFAWAGGASTSSGKLSIPGLDFKSPAGLVTGLSGDIVFTSLAPLIAAPGQMLRARGVGALAGISDLSASFGIDETGLLIAGGEAEVGGGRIRIQDVRVPLDPKAPVTGVLAFEGVQIHDMVEASPFGEQLDLAARLSGRVPFEVLEGRIHVGGGELRAIEPGRISLKREALTAIGAQGEGVQAAAPAAPNTFTDMAYQAMENLAFETLDAKIDSLPEGRLGVLFHIIGKHDPPTKQRIRLSIPDLLARKFMNKPLPLPSGTGVNLTLDSTLNLDQLLSEFAQYLRLRGSGGVQP